MDELEMKNKFNNIISDIVKKKKKVVIITPF
jgi:SepF-like predicted cell division protein (DUF552 family)